MLSSSRVVCETGPVVSAARRETCGICGWRGREVFDTAHDGGADGRSSVPSATTILHRRRSCLWRNSPRNAARAITTEKDAARLSAEWRARVAVSSGGAVR